MWVFNESQVLLDLLDLEGCKFVLLIQVLHLLTNLVKQVTDDVVPLLLRHLIQACTFPPQVTPAEREREDNDVLVQVVVMVQQVVVIWVRLVVVVHIVHVVRVVLRVMLLVVLVSIVARVVLVMVFVGGTYFHHAE